MAKTMSFYIGFVGVMLVAIWLIIMQGESLEIKRILPDTGVPNIKETAIPYDKPVKGPLDTFKDEVSQNFRHPLSLLIIQIIIIIIFSRAIGLAFRKIGQPLVIGEIFAGIILGPSVLGTLFPHISGFLFPANTLSNLQFLSQIGLMLFMFIVGMELDVGILRHRARQAVLLSHSSIVLSYLLGVLLAYFIYDTFAPENITFISFALFLGVAMSIMAFPVLARIIQEKNLAKTPLGHLTLTTAAVDDITAWCILAIVIAIVKAGSALNASVTLGLVAAYIFIMLKVLQPFLQRLGKIYISHENMSKTFVAFVFVVLLFSSFTTEVIGIHALFGAFMAGVVIPGRMNFKSMIAEKVEDVSLILLLPLFFVFTGLRTEIGLINSPSQWLLCGVIILLAVGGKFGGSVIAARYLKQNWKNALSLGVLMNTRGLMELVVVNIGYDLGIIGPELFAMFVIMAISTTFMTGPLMYLISRIFPKEVGIVKGELPANKILISFGKPETGISLMKIAWCLSEKESNSTVRLLHITPRSDISFQDSVMYEKSSFEPIKHLARRLGVRVETVYRSTGKVKKEILKETERSDVNLLLLGKATSVFTTNILGGKIKNILDRSRCSVGVFIEHNFSAVRNVLFIIDNPDDYFLHKYLVNISVNVEAEMVIFDRTKGKESSEFIAKLPSECRGRVKLGENKLSDHSYLSSFSLIVISLSGWHNSSDIFPPDKEELPSSVLIVKGSPT